MGEDDALEDNVDEPIAPRPEESTTAPDMNIPEIDMEEESTVEVERVESQT